jgi:hypothetical protein
MGNARTSRRHATLHSPGSANDKRNERKWKAVDYEREMFFSTLAILKNRNPVVEGNEILKNAVVESAIIHVRNLCCIFLSVPTREGDGILLRELTIGWKRDAARDKLIMLLEKAFLKTPSMAARFSTRSTSGSLMRLVEGQMRIATTTRRSS